MVGIYKLEFINNSYYIGSSMNIDKRYYEHCSDLKNNRHDNIFMQRIYNKYNKLPKITILQELLFSNTIEKLHAIEQIYLDRLMKYESCLNIAKKAGCGPGLKTIYKIGQKCKKCNTKFINVEETKFIKDMCIPCYKKQWFNEIYIKHKKQPTKYYIGQKCINQDCNNTYIKANFTKDMCNQCYDKQRIRTKK